MSRKLVDPKLLSLKDVNGSYIKPEEPKKPEDTTPVFKDADVDLDSLLHGQLLALARMTKHLVDSSLHGADKDNVDSLSKCIKLTLELKEKERELLDKLEDEDLDDSLE